MVLQSQAAVGKERRRFAAVRSGLFLGTEMVGQIDGVSCSLISTGSSMWDKNERDTYISMCPEARG